VLTIIDTFSRFSPAAESRFSYRGSDVVETLERVALQYGYQRLFASIRARSSCHGISICGRMPEVSRSTSRGRANRPTTRSSSRSTASSGRSACGLMEQAHQQRDWSGRSFLASMWRMEYDLIVKVRSVGRLARPASRASEADRTDDTPPPRLQRKSSLATACAPPPTTENVEPWPYLHGI